MTERNELSFSGLSFSSFFCVSSNFQIDWHNSAYVRRTAIFPLCFHWQNTLAAITWLQLPVHLWKSLARTEYQSTPLHANHKNFVECVHYTRKPATATSVKLMLWTSWSLSSHVKSKSEQQNQQPRQQRKPVERSH